MGTEQNDAKWMMNLVKRLFAQCTVRRGRASCTDLRHDFDGITMLCDALAAGRRVVGTMTVCPQDGLTRFAATAVSRVAVAAVLALAAGVAWA